MTLRRVQARLSPMENSLLAASTPVAIASGIFVAQRLSTAVGRVPAILTFRCPSPASSPPDLLRIHFCQQRIQYSMP